MHSNPDLLALLALGEPVGTPEDHRHLAGCDTCRAELTALQEVVGVGRRTTIQDVLVSPPPQLWQRISHELSLHPSIDGTGPSANAAGPTLLTYELPDPTTARSGIASAAAADPAAEPRDGTGDGPGGDDPPTPADRTAPAPSSRSIRVASLVLAAALALAVGIGLGGNLDRLVPGTRETASVELNALPPWPGASGKAVLEQDRDGNRWLVVDIVSPEAPSGPREVWLSNTRAEPMMAMGFLRSDGSGRFPVPPEMDLASYPLVDVSQEPKDDESPGHSGNSMLRGKFPV